MTSPPDVPPLDWSDVESMIESSMDDHAYLPTADVVDMRTRKSIDPEGSTMGERASRRVDLRPYLDGTHVNPKPSVGAYRADGQQMLYSARWHTGVGLTGAGKSWFGLQHVCAAMDTGPVVYAHFEEAGPQGTIARLRQLGEPDGSIVERFIWLDCSIRFRPGEFATTLAELVEPPKLVVLDGINAACSMHGWSIDKIEAIGDYRREFVTPSTRLGAAVLSLGHPPKARDRQGERHGFGSTAWLDEVDGVSFRLEASNSAPIRRGKIGFTNVYVVKDRYGEVDRHGEVDSEREAGWFAFATMALDDRESLTTVEFQVPRPKDEGMSGGDKYDQLGKSVVEYLAEIPLGTFPTLRWLKGELRAFGVMFKDVDLEPALSRLAKHGVIDWPYTGERVARPGRLVRAPEAEEDP